MKTYRVSLACKVPLNFEVEVEAKNETEARNKAIEEFDNWDEDNLTEPDYQELQLDMAYGKDKYAGVDIEQLN